jgi:hypothetical protein
MKLHNDWRESELSALFDGELMSDDAERCLQKDGEAVVERWCDYQNVRSALQGSFAAGPSSVAVLAWSVVGQRSESPAQAPLAQAAPAQNFAVSTFASPYAKVQGFARMPAEPVASARSDANAAQREVMLRDPALDEFLRAHGARAGGMALENTSGFMRNATYGEDGL